MSRADFVVGAVAMLLGLAAIVAAIRTEKAAYEPPPVRWVEQRYGRPAARVCYAVIGLVLIVLGGILFAGIRFPWQQ